MAQEESRALEFVRKRAEEEIKALGMTEISPELIFLELLKLPEKKADNIAPGSRYKEQIGDEIQCVAAMLQEIGIEPGKGREDLRRALVTHKEAVEGYRAVERLFSKAGKMDDRWITAVNVLSILLNEPTPMLQKVFDLGFLVKLTERMRKLREALLNKIYGQNHVVHAFVEGVFNSELLVAVDHKRNRPRGIFVFAGPPGVGKTFFAEQAAEELSIPYKRFDMSSYVDHQAHLNLIGFKHTGQTGLLTGFVKKNPHCILLFDEVEKAHLNMIQLFLQILDAGTLQDDFLDEKISFKDVLIIFTTNAGKQLYEGDFRLNAAGLPRQTILNALETDTHPQTGKPFFPSTICSRLATGYLMMFNYLQIYDLERICKNEFNRFANLFYQQYTIHITEDDLLAPTLIFAEGGQTDARTLRAQTELFLKKEIFELCRLWENDAKRSLKEIEKIHFEVIKEELPADVEALFDYDEKPGILFFGENASAGNLLKIMSDEVKICWTQDDDEALTMIAERQISCVLLELLVEHELNEGTVGAFFYTPITAKALGRCRKFLKKLYHYMPEIPVYLIGENRLVIDKELYASFVQAGVRDKLVWPSQNNAKGFSEQIKKICSRVYLQNMATHLALQHKVLSFETAPKLSEDKKEVAIRLRELTIRRALFAGDTREVLNDVEKPDVCFEQIFGAKEAKKELTYIVDFLMKPRRYSTSDVRIPRGILLYGPPGTGKTMLARAMAGESDVAFISVAGSSFVTKYQGSGPEAIRQLFQRARRYAPSIIFIDEIDAIGRVRGSSGSAHGEEMALNALLSEMDGFATDHKRPVFVLAATNVDVTGNRNSINALDPALLRRFDRKILVDSPNREDRRSYLETMLQKEKQVSTIMIEHLADRSLGFSIADLSKILQQAWIVSSTNNRPLDDELLEETFETVSHGEKKDIEYKYVERVAWHEAGHAYMCYQTGNTPSYITIVSRGNHSGYTEEYTDKHKPAIYTKEELLKRVRTSLAGRAAEMIRYGDNEGLSTGCSDDLQNATKLVRAMIYSYGMDDVIGMTILSEKEATLGPLAEKIIQRVSEIIRQELEETIRIISEGKPKISKLVDVLLKKNRLTKEEIEKELNEYFL